MSLRLKLTLLYTGVLSITLIASGILLLLLLGRTLEGEVDPSLVAMAQEFDARPWLRDETQRPKVQTTGRSNITTYTEVFGPRGVLLASSENLAGSTLDIDAAKLRNALAGKPQFVSTYHAGKPVRAYVAPLRSGDRVRGVVVIARSTETIPQTLAKVRRNLLRIDAALVAIALVSGFLLARAALHPIDRITRTAAAIGEGLELDRRIEPTGARDEMGRLVTTLNRMLDRVARAYRRQETALEAQRRFVADASHDLRTPITSIIGNLQFLQRAGQLPRAEQETVLRDIGASATRMQHLVNDLLTLARADAGQLQPRKDVVQALILLEGVAHEARALNTGVGLRIEAPPDLALIGDAEHLHRVLMILVENALKHTAAEGSVRLTAQPYGPHVQLQVIDTGAGIAPEHLPRIFDRFYRADTARSGGGTGLGLSIAQATVVAMGGAISVESTAGAGTRFSITLPKAEKPATVLGSLALNKSAVPEQKSI